MTNTGAGEEIELTVCGNCAVWHANGDGSGIEDLDAFLAAVAERWSGYVIIILDHEGETDFRFADCEGCGCPAGERHAAVAQPAWSRP